MNLETKRGPIVVRESTLSDAGQFRALRLDGLQESPIAFPVDYTANLNHPMSFWESRLKSDETGILFFAEHDNQLIGATGIRRGEFPKQSTAQRFGAFTFARSGEGCALPMR